MLWTTIVLILELQEPDPKIEGSQMPCALEFRKTRAPGTWRLSPQSPQIGPEYACRSML